jgi:hypothetical protein
LNRQLDAAIYGAGLALFARRAPRYVAACVVPAAAVAALLLLYQAAQFGSPWTTGYALYEPTLLRLYGDTNAYPFTIGHLLDVGGQWCHLQWLGELTAWTVPGATVLGAIGLTSRRLSSEQEAGTARDVVRRWMILVAGLELVAMLFYGHDAGPSYGPRYLFPLLGPILFGIGAAWQPFWRWATRASALAEQRAALAFVAVLAAGLLRVGFLVDAHRDALRHSTQLYSMVERAQLRDAVVIVKGPFPERFTRNGTRFDGPVLFVAPRDDDAAIASFFPDRAVYVAAQPWETADWTLHRLTP